MSGKLAKSRAAAKPADIRNLNQNCRNRNQISAVMQKVKGSLPKPNSAETLAFLTGHSLSTSQKLLSGHAWESGDMLRAMCRTKLVVDVLLGLTDGATDPVALRTLKVLKRLKLELELERLDAGVEP